MTTKDKVILDWILENWQHLNKDQESIDRNLNWYSHLENTMELTQKIYNRTTIWSSNPSSG